MGIAEQHPTVDPLPDGYLDLYKLAVEMADRVSARKLTANTFFLTLAVGLLAWLEQAKFPRYGSVAGLLLSAVWWVLLHSYRDLNRAKFDVITAMEERLPARIYTDEWAVLRPDQPTVPWHRRPSRWFRQYREIGWAERVVPLTFGALFALLFVTHA